jgi:hypothetical protein
MNILIFHHYDQVKLFWDELNHSYKDGELTFDWETHKIIWENFYKPRQASLMILVGLHKKKCVGIFPFISEKEDYPPQWSISEDFIIGREYFCPPDKIHLFRNLLPDHWVDDMSCFYTPKYPQFFKRAPGGLVDIKTSSEAYLASLKKKSRHTLRRVEQINSDIRVRVDNRFDRAEISGVLQSQLEHWKKRSRDQGGDETYSPDKIHTDLKIMERAQAMNKLIAITLYLDGKVVAANFSVRRGKDRVDDYICLRNCEEEFALRSLGFHAILKNMEACRKLNIHQYDFSSCSAEYKRRFINTSSFYYYLPSKSSAVQATENGEQLLWKPVLAADTAQLVSDGLT